MMPVPECWRQMPGDAPAQGQQHGVRGHGRMPDERRFLARVEEAQPHVVVRGAGGEHECHLGMRELACHRQQGGIVVSVGVEDHGRRIAGKARGRECVDLKNAQ